MNAAQNRQAFRDSIAHSEIGPALLAMPSTDNGYRVIVGSTPAYPILMTDYADHPRKHVWIASIKNTSTAAGRYQILERYFDVYKAQLGLPDFGPLSQDRICMQLIGECHAIDDIDAGRFNEAIGKCKSRWASLPGAGYDQHENSMESLRFAYLKAGGAVTA